MRKSFSLMLLLVAFSVAFSASFFEASSQELTGDSPPTITVIPVDDSLSLLEAQVDDAEWKFEVAKAELNQVSKAAPSTVAERLQHMEAIREARKNRAEAMAAVHQAKAAWCTYYASAYGDKSGQYLRSAYAHRRTAQAMQAQAYALTATASPSVQYSGKHHLSIE